MVGITLSGTQALRKVMKEQRLLNFLLEYITPERKAKFEAVLSKRTRHLTVLLEDIFQPHNASAVLRSCDLTGVQDVHIIENNYIYDINPDVVVGSTKWLNLYKYNELPFNTIQAYEKLHNKGYRIVATSPHHDGYTPETLPLDKPLALVFGTEKTGLSDYALQHADDLVRIPMVGFTESFNISVSAALLLYTLSRRLHTSDISWQLSRKEKDELLLQWCRNTIKRVEVLEETFKKRFE